MILNFDEVNPGYGKMPVNDGTFWRSQLTQVYSQLAKVTQSAAAYGSLVAGSSNQLGSVSLPAGQLNAYGRSLLVTFGGYGTTGSTPGTVSFELKLGSNVVATTATVAAAASITAAGWYAQALLTCKATNATGGSGLLDCTGMVWMGTLSATVAWAIANGTTGGTQAPATQVSIDLTQAYVLDVGITPSNANDSFTLTNLMAEERF